MKTRTPVEVTTRHATTVDTLQDAFAFVMSQLDHLGGRPTISITPMTSWAPDDNEAGFFEVSVETRTSSEGEE